MLRRREFLMAPMAATALLASATGAALPMRRFDAATRLRSLESGPARLGVRLLDTGTGEVSGNWVEEQFAMCSTFKLAPAQPVRRITTGDPLKGSSRDQLLLWMQNTGTGANRLRAGLPPEWRTGNKTGTGRTEGTTNKCNDVAITFPRGMPPIIIAVYFDSGEFTAQTERRQRATKSGNVAYLTTSRTQPSSTRWPRQV